jgi:Uma2 family endonuclease
MIQTTDPLYTAEDYLASQIHSTERHEFVDGEVRPMTGGTPDHNVIAGNVLVALKLALWGKEIVG